SLGLSTTVADARFAKPLDHELVKRLVQNHEILLTIEEGAIGGFGTQVLHFLAGAHLLPARCKIRTMFLPDVFVGHGTPKEQYEQAGLTARHILAEIMAMLDLDAKTLDLKTLA
ncbi:MAG: transketolase C-terminal domain-containing protein, partial [Pseudomonadota bacterium]